MNFDFRVTKRFVKELLEVLDEIVKEIRQEKKAYPYAECEQKREMVKERLRKLPELGRLFCDKCSEKSGKTKES